MISVPACRQLQARGVDIVHVLEVGLRSRPDSDVLEYAVRERRILLIRNYRDFAPLAEAYSKRSVPFPGVLFIAASIGQADAGAHVAALEDFAARNQRGNPVENTYGWLRAVNL